MMAFSLRSHHIQRPDFCPQAPDRPRFSVAGMRVLHWLMLVLTILLLVCEVTISQLCNSLITLVDGFHTLVILVRMAFIPQTANTVNPPLSSLDSAASPPHPSSSSAASPANLPAESSIQPLPASQATTDESALPEQPPTPPLSSSLSYTHHRIQVVVDFFSALLLLSLCVSYVLEIISSCHERQPAQNHLILVEVSAVSLLHKILVLWLNWDHRQASKTRYPEVLGEEGAKGEADPGRLQHDAGQARPAVEDSLYNGALVICNPNASVLPDTEAPTPELPSAAPQQGSKDCEEEASVADLSRSKDISKDSIRMGHLGSENASDISPVCKSQDIERPVPTSPWPVCLLLLVRVIQGLCTSLFALISSVTMLLYRPECLHSPGACSFLVYLDPCLSVLAIIFLIATAAPQLHRYGLLLLQATPPHICVSDLGSRIASVPGVKGVHELHIWQLNESIVVASVHVHCHDGFRAHRCADLVSGVTKVLQSIGVNCCTIQPEFASCSGPSAGSDDASPVVHKEDASLPRLLACSLACSKACADSMCCSPVEEETRTLPEPPAGEPKNEPLALVIENTIQH